MDTAKLRGLRALRNTHRNVALYSIQTTFLPFVYRTFAESLLIPELCALGRKHGVGGGVGR